MKKRKDNSFSYGELCLRNPRRKFAGYGKGMVMKC